MEATVDGITRFGEATAKKGWVWWTVENGLGFVEEQERRCARNAGWYECWRGEKLAKVVLRTLRSGMGPSTRHEKALTLREEGSKKP